MTLAGEALGLAVREREPDRADRLARYGAAGSGDATHRQRDIGMRAGERAFGHRAYDAVADGAFRFDELFRDAEIARFRGVRITDETAIEPVGAARDVGAQLGDPAAGAGFSRREPSLRGHQSRGGGAREHGQVVVTWNSHARQNRP
jgi:hypothetical protein